MMPKSETKKWKQLTNERCRDQVGEKKSGKTTLQKKEMEANDYEQDRAQWSECRCRPWQLKSALWCRDPLGHRCRESLWTAQRATLPISSAGDEIRTERITGRDANRLGVSSISNFVSNIGEHFHQVEARFAIFCCSLDTTKRLTHKRTKKKWKYQTKR